MLSRRNIAIVIAVVFALGAVAALASGGGRSSEPEPPEEETTVSSTPNEPQGDPREKGDGPIAVTDEGRLAGRPVATARQFVSEWVNRTASAQELRRQRPILVGLSTGEFAQLVQVTIDDALATGDYGAENEGEVLVADDAPGEEGTAVVVVTQERLVQDGEPLEPYRYITYLARLEPVGAGYAVSALEPQS